MVVTPPIEHVLQHAGAEHCRARAHAPSAGARRTAGTHPVAYLARDISWVASSKFWSISLQRACRLLPWGAGLGLPDVLAGWTLALLACSGAGGREAGAVCSDCWPEHAGACQIVEEGPDRLFGSRNSESPGSGQLHVRQPHSGPVCCCAVLRQRLAWQDVTCR